MFCAEVAAIELFGDLPTAESFLWRAAGAQGWPGASEVFEGGITPRTRSRLISFGTCLNVTVAKANYPINNNIYI